jgi:hypothetical protein
VSDEATRNAADSRTITLKPVAAAEVRERRWANALAGMGGYIFDIRLGGGPDTFTAWTVEREGLENVPFMQATGATGGEALHALLDKLDEYEIGVRDA